MNLRQVQALVEEPVSCGYCSEAPLLITVLDTGEYFSFFAACPKCHLSCSTKLEKLAPPSVVMKTIQKVRRAFRMMEE